MLAPLGLSAKQLVVASAVLAMFFPCIATFVVFIRELGVQKMLISTGIMCSAALMTGVALNALL
jgi:ferrous iron transport protein B